MRVLGLAVMMCVAGCLDLAKVSCGDLACPVGTVCTRDGGCAPQADVAACDGLADGAQCKAANGGAGTCEGGACRTGLCGNGVIDVGEACDDGNQVSGDGCRADCGKVEVCGDSQLDTGEACDDGNQNAADGCDACKLTAWSATTVVGTELHATSTALADPSGIAVDGSGRVFVADLDNHRIVRIELDGSITTVAGTGNPGFSGDGGAATSAQLAAPNAVAIDGLGRMFIADTGNQRIRRVELDGTITTLAGTGAQSFGGDGGPAILAQLDTPYGVATDGLGRVLVADTLNHRIRRIDVDGTITTIAGTGVEGFGGDTGPATNAQLDTPYGVEVDGAGRILIADTFNQRIRRVDQSGTITTLAGTGAADYAGDGGPAIAAHLQYPVATALDAQGRIAIADTLNHAVRRIETDDTIISLAGNGVQGFGGDNGPASAAQLAAPFGVAIDGQGIITIADSYNQRIRRIDAGDTITTIAGTGTFGFGGDGGAATSAHLSTAFGLALDAMGRVIIADTFNQRVRRVETDGTITSVAGTATYGFNGDGGQALAAQLARPAYVAIDLVGRVVIADTYNERIRRVETDGTITTLAGTGVSGYSGDNGAATSARLSNPNGVAVDGFGRIVIADTYNQRIRRIATNGKISTIAGTGAFGFGGDGGSATSAQLAYPYGIAVDAQGRILIGDTGNNRVRRIETDGTITTVAGTGIAGYDGDGQLATTAQLNSPYGVAVDNEGRIVIADSYNFRLRRIETDGTISTIAGTGIQGNSGDGSSATNAQLANPLSVAVDAQDRIVIMDTNNARVRRIETDGTITTLAGQIDPDHVGPVGVARLDNPQAIVATPDFTLVAGGTSGTLEAIANGHVEVFAGRYPQATATGNLARYRTQSFGTVGGTAFDPATGSIYITETSSHRLDVITRVDPSNPATWTIAPLANTAGSAGFADGAAATAQFRSPSGLYLDGTTLYIADTGNHAIRALDLGTNTVTTVVNTSHALGFAGDGGPATAALLFGPTAITRCPNGDMMIADTDNNRIRRVDGGGDISTVLGDGVPASSGDGMPAKTFPVDGPRSLACDGFGNLFVSSTATVRLLPATDDHVVDGNGAVQTIYGAPPRDHFPASVTSCLTGLAVTDATHVQVADACTGLLVELARSAP